jgi:hypothetical protein
MYPFSRRVRDNPTWGSIPVVAALAWLVSLPWAVVHGPVDLQWVLAQALGAAVIPMVAGWVALWRARGGLRGAVWAVMGSAGLLLALEVWSRSRMGS